MRAARRPREFFADFGDILEFWHVHRVAATSERRAIAGVDDSQTHGLWVVRLFYDPAQSLSGLSGELR